MNKRPAIDFGLSGFPRPLVRQRALLAAVSLLLVASAAQLAARAEGAVKLLECDIVRVCDAAGSCNADSGEIRFTMEPVELAVGGAGSYQISYGEGEAAMQAVSDAGPFFWSVGSKRNALIASSETLWLWHELSLDPAPQAAIRFLSCRFQQ